MIRRIRALMFGAVAAVLGALALPVQAQTTLKFSAYFSADNFLYVGVMAPFMREVETGTKGQIKFEEYPNAALGKMTDQLDLLRNSIADVAMFIPSYSKGRFNFASAGTLPFAFTSSEQGTGALNELNDKWFQSDLKDVKILFQFTPAPAGVLSRKAIDNIEAFKGMKMRSAGATTTEMLKMVGSVIVTVPLPEIYVALERGVVEGSIIDSVTATTYKLYEVAKFYTPLNFSSVVATIGMSKRAFDKLTPEQQKVVMEAAARAAARIPPLYAEKIKEAAILMKGANVRIVEFAPVERERFEKMVRPLWDKWVKDLDDKGVRASAFMADFRKSIASNR